MITFDSIRVGDVVTIIGRGAQNCVAAGARWMRGGNKEILFGVLDGSKKGERYYRLTSKHARFIKDPSARFTAAQKDAAVESVRAIQRHRSEFEFARTEARRERIGDVVAYVPAVQTERFKVGDVVTIRGASYDWHATVKSINPRTGKVGIEREVQEWQKEAARQKADAFALGKHYAPNLMAGRRRPRGPSTVRWIDPRFIATVNGVALPAPATEA